MTGTARSHTPGSCKRCHSHSGVADIAVTRVANHSGPAPPSQTSLSLRAVISAAVKAVMRNFMSPSYEHCPPYPPENANIASLIQIMFTATRREGLGEFRPSAAGVERGAHCSRAISPLCASGLITPAMSLRERSLLLTRTANE